MARRMSGRELRVWMMRVGGLPVSAICRLTGLAAPHVRSIVTGAWFDYKMGEHHA